MLNSIKNIDLFRKEISEYSHTTVIGGIMSLISFGVLFFFFILETNDYLSSSLYPSLSIQSSDSDRLQINLNLTIHKVPCLYIDIHYSDSASTLYTNANIYKIPIENNEIVWKIYEKIQDPNTYNLEELKCGSCYGADLYEGHCCNSCDEVLKAFTQRGWVISDFSEITQCKEKQNKEDLNRGSGCLLIGNVLTKKIPGNLHIELNIEGRNLAQFAKSKFDGSHTIHHFGFSEPKGVQTQGPLDGTSIFNKFLSQYYFKISQVIKEEEKMYYASGNFVKFDITSIPQILINYDFDPITTVYKIKKNFSHYLVSLCAILGGWFAVSIFISKCIIK